MCSFLRLQGVNRAFPFVSIDEADDFIEVQTPMLFQLVRFCDVTSSLLDVNFVLVRFMSLWLLDVKIQF